MNKLYIDMIYFSEASKYLIEVFTHVEESERDEILDKMIEIIQKQPRKCQLKDIFTRTCDLTIGNFGLKDKNHTHGCWHLKYCYTCTYVQITVMTM